MYVKVADMWYDSIIITVSDLIQDIDDIFEVRPYRITVHTSTEQVSMEDF